jgi:serine/threonine-protein phosphatase
MHHKNKVITVFSAPNYCGYVGNVGAVVEVDELGYLSLYLFAHLLI